MKLRLIIITWATALVGMSALAQHSPLTSQYLFNGLLINPAYAGSRDVLAANLTYRQQWVGLSGAPSTQVFSIHSPVNKKKVGLGLMLFNDRIGVSNETGFFTNYAYRIRFPHGKLAFGIGAGVTMLRGDWHTVAIQQAGDAAFAEPTRSAWRPNFSSGIHYYTKTWFVGMSVPFLLAHSYNTQEHGWMISSTRTDLQPMLTGGYLWKLDHDLKLKPSALVRYRPESGVQADLSANLIIKDKVWVGASYRTNDAVIGMLEVLPTPQWRFGYAYDIGLTPLRRYHGGSHELMVQYEFGFRIRVRDPRYF